MPTPQLPTAGVRAIASSHRAMVALVLSAAIALASIAGVMAQGLGPAGPSPAQNGGSVIAQGVVEARCRAATLHAPP